MAAPLPRRTNSSEALQTLGDEPPPPPYSSVADPGSTLEANFARPYEVQDSGMFSSQPSEPSSSSSSSSSTTMVHPHPAGPPPAPPRHPSISSHHTGGSSWSGGSFQQPQGPPPQQSGQAPQPHIDGISSFTRPALPHQTPAHTAPVSPSRQPTQYSPTVNPTSGQPLLHKGKLLVYTNGFYCQKCHNTGYKAYDPSNPHERCWEKFGRQFNSAIWNSPNYSFQNQALQKPLPNTRYQANLPPVPPPQQSHPGYYVAGQQGPPPPQQPYYPQQQNGYYGPPQNQFYGPPPQQPIISHHMGYMPAPPPGALVVRPGDPRIGGRLCYDCGGRGTVAAGFLLLDEDTCRMCNGTGRVFFP